ncbi:MAG: hypothetical protein K0S34_570 [Bacillales bacterium]|jgi:hypothetical protein|nr:hypothetical protein [Bacillales bacterium]
MLNLNIVSQIISDKNNSVYKSEMLTRPGQLVFGKITEIFPEGYARIQIGDKSVIAKLETQVQTDQSYIFFIENTEDSLITLKVLTNSDKFDLVAALNRLKSEWGLPSNSSNIDKILISLIENGKPLQKEFIQSATTIFRNVKVSDDDINTLLTILDKRLTLTPKVFDAIKELNTNKPMTLNIEKIISNLQDIETPSAIKLLNVLNETFKQGDLRTQGEPSVKISNKYENISNNLVSKDVIVAVLKNLLDGNIKFTQQERENIINNVINEMDLKNTDGKKLISMLETKENLMLNSKQDVVKAILLLNNQELTINKKIENLIKEVDFKHSIKSQDINKLIDKIIDGNIQFKENVKTSLLTKVLEMSQTEEASFEVKVKNSLINIMDKIGFEYEALINSKTNIAKEDKVMIKQLLLEILTDDSIPQNLKSEIESLVNKITGSQLLSVNKDNPLQTIFTQIPFVINDFKGDLKIQWQGKKNNEGKIDPNFCRILFYLDLANIGSTILDVHVINKVVNLQIFNENKIIEKLVLKDNSSLYKQLQNINYTLGSVKFSNNDVKLKGKKDYNSKPFLNNSGYQGVDIKI